MTKINSITTDQFIRFTYTNVLVNALAVTLYLLWSTLFVGLRSDQFFLISIYLLAYYATPFTRKFVLAFSIFILYWIIYDSLRILPNYKVNPVHLSEPYNFEKWIFGLNIGENRVTLNEYFAANHTPFLDFLTGVFYLNWVPLPLGFAFYFFATGKKELFLGFSIVFFLVNIIGFVIYYVYPAAPPWYFASHGAQFIPDTLGSRAGFVHFDELVGIDVFKNIYNKNSNVFAAIPSLHSSYPLILLYWVSKLHKKWITVTISIFLLGIWFSAVYSGHHYLIDVLLGASCAIIGIFAYTQLLKIPKFTKWIDLYGRNI